MVSIDHTARSRLLVPTGPKSKWVNGKLYPLSAEQGRRQSYASKLAGATLAVAVLERMLQTDSSFKHNHPHGEPDSLLPFNPVQVNGLKAAIYFLHQYVDTLHPEKSG
jgi:hypothetical protein